MSGELSGIQSGPTAAAAASIARTIRMITQRFILLGRVVLSAESYSSTSRAGSVPRRRRGLTRACGAHSYLHLLLLSSAPDEERNAGWLANPEATGKNKPSLLRSSRFAPRNEEVCCSHSRIVPPDRYTAKPFGGDDQRD